MTLQLIDNTMPPVTFRRVLKFCKLLFPYLRHFARHGIDPASLNGYDKWHNDWTWLRRLLENCWQESSQPGVRRYRLEHLHVLNNKSDLPCTACGGQCCKREADGSGFGRVQVFHFEEFYKHYWHLLTPGCNPGQSHINIAAGESCPLLGPNNLCMAYYVRPYACSNFNCIDDLARRSWEADYSRWYGNSSLAEVKSAVMRVLDDHGMIAGQLEKQLDRKGIKQCLKKSSSCTS